MGEKVRGRRLGKRLSPGARAAWAKSSYADDGYLPLWRHMSDSAATAGLLWDRWLPEQVKRLVAQALPGGFADARALAVWLAGVHDVGKATPAFACQVEPLAEKMRRAGLAMPTMHQFGEDRRMAPHGLAGQEILQDWLVRAHGWNPRRAAQFAVVVGGHHGVPPDAAQVMDVRAHPRLLRTPGESEALWAAVQTELLEACADDFGVRERLADWRSVRLPQTVQVVLSALVIMADWIASNRDLFPYGVDGTDGASARTDEERVLAAWEGLGLPGPWQAQEPTGTPEELFASRFALPDGARPHPVQRAAIDLARRMPGPGLMMIEAPMGRGKTEAALAVAEIFAARSGAGGCFFALPTMATGNAMFPRVLDWLERLPDAQGQRLTVGLVHSKAALNEEYQELRSRGRQQIAAVDMDGDAGIPRPGSEKREAPAGLVAHQWLSGRKKAMLSSFVVGTIDQLLFAGLKSQHLALRHLSVAGKVVVIDEAHAFDAYMNEYLDRVLSWLGAYRVPVVVLSATLPAERRRALAEAYAGRAQRAVGFASVAEAEDYPLLTAVSPGHGPVQDAPGDSGGGARVRVERMADDEAALADRLEELDDGCVLVIRNTVPRVLETARVLRERFGDDTVTVAHARFVDLDRAAKDKALVDRYGPKSTSRPKRHIVVASQVAEQSLDVDFDLLVTDLAPVDLILQRMGRLHRHARTGRPARLRAPRTLVTGVEWGAAGVPEPVSGSQAVYGRHALLRSLAVLTPHLDAPESRPVRIPEDISPLVQTAYGDEEVGPAGWAPALAEARRAHETERAKKKRGASVFRIGEVKSPGSPLIGWLAAGVGDADDTRAGRAQVRDSEESLEVLVVQEHEGGRLTTLPWLGKGRGGLDLPRDAVPTDRAARAAAASALRLPVRLSKPWVIDQVIKELEQFYVDAWQAKESHWLAGELILPVQADCQTRLAGLVLRYSQDDGLEVLRETEG